MNYIEIFFGLCILSLPLLFFIFLLPTMSGWRNLTLKYRATQPFTGKRFWMNAARMRGDMGYLINIGTNSSGLYLSVFPPFSFSHPSLFIPWSDISYRREKRKLIYDDACLEFLDVPGVLIRLPIEFAKKVFMDSPFPYSTWNQEKTKG